LVRNKEARNKEAGNKEVHNKAMSSARLRFMVAAIVVAMPVAASWAATAGLDSLRDPTRPLGFTEARVHTPKLELQAIFKRQSGREAIVSGQRVRTGDVVDGARIESISAHSIVYSYQGQTQSLRLRPQVIHNN
jgi:MSHA biogenesis protein MshK